MFDNNITFKRKNIKQSNIKGKIQREANISDVAYSC